MGGHAEVLAFQGHHSSTSRRSSSQACHRAVQFLAALSQQRERHHSYLTPLLHPSTHQHLCALSAPRYPAASTFSRTPMEADGLLCPSLGTEAEVTLALTGRQSRKASVMVASPFPGRGFTGSIMQLTRACVCRGVGRGRIWLLIELVHPI